jgi:hypothetical protein
MDQTAWITMLVVAYGGWFGDSFGASLGADLG